MTGKLHWDLKRFWTLPHSHATGIVCAWATEKALVGAWTFRGWVPALGKVGHLWALLSVWHLFNSRDILSAQELPSRSGQLCVTHLVTALEKVRTCMWETKIAGDQDCGMLFKASQSCHTDRAFYAKIVNETQILVKINLSWFQCSHTTCFLPILL